jgi:hypothetical protein
VTIPRGHEGNVVLHTIQVFVDNGALVNVAHARTRQLIAQRLRVAGADAPLHLGELHVSSPDFAV